MGFFGRLLGIEDESDRRRARGDSGFVTRANQAGPVGVDNEAQALERYRYMLRTAPPETLEQAHAEAFAKLTPEQRQKVLDELSNTAPPAERSAIAATPTDDSQALARVATRAEIRQPGTLERSLGGGGAMGAMGMGASLLSSFAMGFVGSMVAQSFLSAVGGAFDGGGEEADPDALAENEERAGDEADSGGGDFGGDDFDV
jgi:hypothetical protein